MGRGRNSLQISSIARHPRVGVDLMTLWTDGLNSPIHVLAASVDVGEIPVTTHAALE